MLRRQVLRTLTGAAFAAPLAGTALAGPASATTTASAGTPTAAGRARTPKPATGPQAELQQLLDAEQALGVPGLIAQVRYGDQKYRLASGKADVVTGRPARADYYHRIGGVTKSYVGALVLLLVGERLIDLDKPISRYLPDVVPGDRGRQITVRMLLNHTSGIPDFMVIDITPDPEPSELLFLTPQAIAAGATRRYTPRDVIRIGLEQEPTGTPGSTWVYSSAGYAILGLLIERVTGRTYADELNRRILGPLGLCETYAPGAERRIRGPHLEAYIPWTDGKLRDFSTYDMSFGWASADLVATANDVNKFFRALLSGRLLKPALLEEMKTTVPMIPGEAQFAGYGLGIFWLAGPCGHFWGHDGLAIGHTTYSAHAEDGVSMQLTQAENLNYYETAAQESAGTNPIDVARNAFQGTVVSVFGTCAATPPASPAVGSAAAKRTMAWPQTGAGLHR